MESPVPADPRIPRSEVEQPSRAAIVSGFLGPHLGQMDLLANQGGTPGWLSGWLATGIQTRSGSVAVWSAPADHWSAADGAIAFLDPRRESLFSAMLPRGRGSTEQSHRAGAWCTWGTGVPQVPQGYAGQAYPPPTPDNPAVRPTAARRPASAGRA